MLAPALAILCASTLTQASGDPPRTALLPLLADAGQVRAIAFEDLGRPGGLERFDLLVWDTRSRELPATATDPTTVRLVRSWLEGGGRLLLFSHALRWIHDLGCEDVVPDRRDTRLIGHSDRYSAGRYEYGVRTAEPEHPLFAGLTPFGEHADVFLLAGGHAVRNESCFWERMTPRRAKVLGTFFRTAYGEDRSFAHRCLVTADIGHGRVLAYGCGPLVTARNPHADNLARFVSNAVGWLCSTERGRSREPRIGVLPCLPARLGVDAYSSDPGEPAPTPHPWQLTGPHLPYIAHWGWLGQIDYQRGGGASVDLDYFRSRIVDESAAWGANLLEFYPPDMDHGFPFAWPEDDPIPRPDRYWGGAFDPLWNDTRVHDLIEYAHARGFLVHSFNHPNPVRGPLDEFVAYAERTARDFANPLLHGARRALDGFGTEWFPRDRDARITAALWNYNPGIYQHSTAVLPAHTPNFSGTKMCAFGRLGGLNACGFAETWRDLYHPPLYLSYQADCRTRKPSSAEWGRWAGYGGGSYPDWVLRQVNDFCRDRLAADSAIWWLGEPDSTLHPEYRDYVYGVSMDPIRCAVACALWATGRDGYRETLSALSTDPPTGFASGPDVPHRTAVLQNNYLRLLRGPDASDDAGTLLLDPLRLARFDPDPGGTVRARVLLRGMLSAPGVAIEEPVLLLGVADGSSEEGRPEGGYTSRFEPTGDGLPRRLTYETAPQWPTELRLRFAARVGRYRVRIGALPEARSSVLEVRVDSRPAGFYVTGARAGGSGVSTTAATVHDFEFDIVDPGEHVIVLGVQSGAGHDLDFVHLHRVRTGAIRHTFPAKAGVAATLLETVAIETAAGIRREDRRFEMIADRPVLEVEVSCSSGNAGEGGVLERLRSLDALDVFDASTVVRSSKGMFGRHGDADVWLASRSATGRDDSGGQLASVARVALGVFDTRDEAADFVAGAPSPGASVRALPAIGRRTRDYPLYFVRELDANATPWWTARGAQPSGDVDLVKVYDHPRGAAQVSTDDFLPSGFRPAWGCQHSLAFTNADEPGTCVVKVEKIGPFLFAPRVEFKYQLRSVELDGRDWRYFEDRVVFLPDDYGTYRIDVEAEEQRGEEREPATPTVTRTFLTVRQCRWNASQRTLSLVTEPPPWFTRPLPGDQRYTVMVRTAGLRLIDARGADPIPLDSYRVRGPADRDTMGARGIVLRLQPGTTTLWFGG